MTDTPGLGGISVAIIVWAAWFVFLYGGLTVGCAVAPPSPESGARNGLNALLALITVAVFAWQARGALASWRRARNSLVQSGTREHFMNCLTMGVHAVCAVSMPVIALPVLMLPPCA